MDGLSPALSRLVDDAVAEGFTATRRGNCLTIYKSRGRRVSLGVRVYLSDTGAFYFATRAGADSLVCTAILTIKAVRTVINLPPERLNVQ